jgi:DNA gyrase inhibitor GyrI
MDPTSPSKLTIVEIPGTRLIVCRAEADRPDEIKAAWHTLESKLPTLKGRKFYGLSYTDASEPAYYAGVVPLDAEEEAALGFPALVLDGGKYARVKLMDWTRHTEEIPTIFDQLDQAVRRDPARPAVEFYRSQSELHLLVPIAENKA